MNIVHLAAACALAAIVGGPRVVGAETTSGTVVDLATYVTHDRNMDAMHESMGGAMHQEGRAKHPCPATLGLVTHGGAGVYLLVTQMGSKTAQTLCGKLDKPVSLDATSYEKGGMRAFLVSSVR